MTGRETTGQRSVPLPPKPDRLLSGSAVPGRKATPEMLACGCLPDEDHTKPHWCHHDGRDALVPPPGWLFYVGKRWSTETLETRDCSHVAAPRVVDVVEAL